MSFFLRAVRYFSFGFLPLFVLTIQYSPVHRTSFPDDANPAYVHLQEMQYDRSCIKLYGKYDI